MFLCSRGGGGGVAWMGVVGDLHRTAAAVYTHGSVIGGAAVYWFIGSPAGLGGRVNGAV